ncbi:MAG TPA: carbohydrate-binding module family 20 domain-containing protein, partial [Prolixibacteraceae bacterium]|nr:carbohydrate-binding module family 20 domain-containing protein [Prolixibacteraceae bacterium]
MKLTFHINYETSWGQSLWMSGSSETLGEWDPHRAFPMQYLGNGEWEMTFCCKQGENFTYKYFLRNDSSSLVWEGGNNRTFRAVDRDRVDIRDFWRPQSDPDRVLFSRMFTDVLMKPPKKSGTKQKQASPAAIAFTLQAPRIPPSMTLGIVGNTAVLGNWVKPVLLSSTHYPCWSIEIDADTIEFPLEYKYVLVDRNNGAIRLWEEGNERSIFF